MARLILEAGGERREIKVTGPVTIGRSRSATITLDDKILSREHTQIYLERGRWLVKDLESKNGTFLNGDLVKGPEVLKAGDRIRIGSATLTFLLDPGESNPEPPSRTAPAAKVEMPSTPARPVAARARPRRPGESALPPEVAPGTRFAYTVFLLGVVGGGAYVFKILFVWVFGQLGS